MNRWLAVVLFGFAFVVSYSLVSTQSSTYDLSSEAGSSSRFASEGTLLLIGNIPGEYLNKDKNTYYFGSVEINQRVIQKIQTIDPQNFESFMQTEKNKDKNVIALQRNINAFSGQNSFREDFDVIYPGLLNLHNHTKQNVLPVWGYAKGQFQNRFEWRDWGVYKKSVSQNMNPWIGFGKPIECAAFRWSNLQNMINGTIFLQGPSSCIDGFAIHKVEDADSYVSQKSAVQAPTDLIYPGEMTYVWDVLAPKIRNEGKTYEQALAEDILSHCPNFSMINADNVTKVAGLKILTDKSRLLKECTVGTLHPKFIRYIYFIHPTIAGKKEYLKSPNRSAIIAHLAEGRRQDPYNRLEFQLIKLLGLDQPYVNFIHGVGLSEQDFKEMQQKQMGLVWSPFSNLLLYGETLDIAAAQKAGVRLAIGSDWVPTGSKSVLEEIKLAARYVDRQQMKSLFSDEVLYKMMTENPARMINHWEISSTEAGVGRLAEGAMGSVIAVSLLDANPYTNLVRFATEKDVNLVVVDGAPTYGNTPYLDQAGLKNYEIFSSEIQEADKLTTDTSIPKPSLKVAKVSSVGEDSALEKDETSATDASTNIDDPATVSPDSAATNANRGKFDSYLLKISSVAKNIQLIKKDLCQFAIQKAFVTPNTKTFEPTVDMFQRQTQIDLDRVDDIRGVLAVLAMTQSLNRFDPKGDPKFSLTYFPSLYSCNNPKHLERINNYIRSDGNDELKANLAQRSQIRAVKGMPKTAEALAKSYGQAFEVK